MHSPRNPGRTHALAGRPAHTPSVRSRAALLTAGVIVVALAAGGCAEATNSLHPERETVKTAHVSKVGGVLVDEEGKTLYLFEKDPRGESECYGACLSVWPPVLTDGEPEAEGGAQQSKLSTIRRDDGSAQVAYNGHPLYYYQADTEEGDAYGEGLDQFGAEWYALSAVGQKVEAREGGGGGS